MDVEVIGSEHLQEGRIGKTEAAMDEEERSYVGWIVGAAAVIAAAAIGFYVWRQNKPAEAPPPVPQAQAPAPAPAAEPQIQHPVPASEAEPLPPLESSDALLTDALAKLLGKASPGEIFVIDNLVRRIVATIDNLPRAKVARKVLPLKPVAGSFVVEANGEELSIGADNAARYARYVQVAQSIDPKRAAALYTRLYPLFQRAYEELGYPKGYFNDRLIEVIDHLLAAPEADTLPRLVQPRVRYEFADPALESLSAGQKIMVRIGATNAARVKDMLRALRSEIARDPPKQ